MIRAPRNHQPPRNLRTLSRRDMLKLGLLGSAAMVLPFERRALT
jgi:hypothetical protein